MGAHRAPGTALAIAVALAVAVALPAQSLLVPIPISFNFGGASPMVQRVDCSWGMQIEIDGGKAAREQGCGAMKHAWRVVQETGTGAGSEIALGALGSQQKLALTLAAEKGQGVLSRSGTYLVQLSISYDKCPKQQGQTRINVGACPSSSEGGSGPTYEVQSCRDVPAPGQRKVTITGLGSTAVSKQLAWQLLPIGGGSSSSVSSVSAEASGQGLSCSGIGCVLFVGAGAGKLNPGRSYSIRYSTGDAAAAAAPTAAPTQAAAAPAAAAAAAAAAAGTGGDEKGAGIGLNLGVAGVGLGLGLGSAGVSTAAAAAGSSSSGGWKEAKGPQVDKCPPRITRSAAAVTGSCSSGRRLEMLAAAVDLEEGGSSNLKFYWYVKSARTQDVVLEASGPAVKLEIGQGPGKLPDGRRYLVNLLVTTKAGDQVTSTKEAVGGVFDVPEC